MNTDDSSLSTALGLMSGTSADGMDAAILVTDGEARLEVKGGVTIPYEASFRQSLLDLAAPNSDESKAASIDRELTQQHAETVKQCCVRLGIALAEIDVIGFHGHTIRHDPDSGTTWQLGDGRLLREMTGRPVVYDMRSADMAAGGQGAPLAPLYHRAIIGSRPGTHLILNLGGVGNVTWISGDQIAAGDTGPGCGLLDALVARHTDQAFDEDGTLALAGTIHQNVIDSAFDNIPFFRKPFPKSADRFDFDLVDVSYLSLEDGAASLCALTVAAVVEVVQCLPSKVDHCWVSGGGSHHPLMMELLAQHFPHVARINELGHQEDTIEAECFGWLAVRRLLGLPTSLPQTTGASSPVCGGVLVE